MNYYNENDRFAAAWLRELIADGLIADGEVDERSIEDVTPADLVGYRQCHFFAGIGVWSLALRLAGWPDEWPVWTGSCPCQPFSAAGKGGRIGDERHLWPEFYRLIDACRPAVIIGEQVAGPLVLGGEPSKDLLALWDQQATLGVLQDRLRENLSLRLQDMPEPSGKGMGSLASRFDSIAGKQTDCDSESKSVGEGLAVRSNGGVGAATLGCGSVRSDGDRFRHALGEDLEHSVRGPTRREPRLYAGQHQDCALCDQHGLWELGRATACADRLRDIEEAQGSIERAIAEIGAKTQGENGLPWLYALQLDLGRSGYTVGACCTTASSFGAPHIRQRLYWMADAEISDGRLPVCERGSQQADAESRGSGETSLWSDAIWLPCRDGKRRPAQSDIFPLAPTRSIRNRVGTLRGAGNALNVAQAQGFIEALMDPRYHRTAQHLRFSSEATSPLFR